MKQKSKSPTAIKITDQQRAELSLVKGCEVKIHSHLTSYIGYCLHKVALRLRAKLDQKIAKHGLVVPQYGMLVILKEEGQMTQLALGQYMAMDKATMVRMIDGLESKGYMKRTASTKDRRAKILTLTEKGRNLVSLLHKLRTETEREFLQPLTVTERTQLREMILKLMV